MSNCHDCRRPLEGAPESDCKNAEHQTTAIWRDPLAFAMISAWLGLPPDRVPKKPFQWHTCQATADAWQRVADAARAHIAQESKP